MNSTIETLNLPVFIRLRIVWIAKSLQKLVNLGMLEAVDQEEFDYDIPNVDYENIDNNRDMIKDDEIHKVLELLNYIGEVSLCDETLNHISKLLVEYKNNRNDMLVYCFNCMLEK